MWKITTPKPLLSNSKHDKLMINFYTMDHQNITDCSIRVLSVTPTKWFVRVIDNALLNFSFQGIYYPAYFKGSF